MLEVQIRANIDCRSFGVIMFDDAGYKDLHPGRAGLETGAYVAGATLKYWKGALIFAFGTLYTQQPYGTYRRRHALSGSR